MTYYVDIALSDLVSWYHSTANSRAKGNNCGSCKMAKHPRLSQPFSLNLMCKWMWNIMPLFCEDLGIDIKVIYHQQSSTSKTQRLENVPHCFFLSLFVTFFNTFKISDLKMLLFLCENGIKYDISDKPHVGNLFKGL